MRLETFGELAHGRASLIAASTRVGVAGSFGQFFLNQAFRYGEVSLLAPLDYSGLVWAALLGFLLWGDIPGTFVWVGAAIIVTAGIYIVRREAMLRRRIKSGES